MVFFAGQILTADDLNELGTFTVFVPTWVSLTVGDGVNNCSYAQVGDLIIARYKFTFGSTSAITGTPNPTLPVPGHANIARGGGGTSAEYRDVSASTSYLGFVIIASITTAFFLKANVAGAADQLSGVSATTPFTWAPGDILSGHIIYEAA